MEKMNTANRKLPDNEVTLPLRTPIILVAFLDHPSVELINVLPAVIGETRLLRVNPNPPLFIRHYLIIHSSEYLESQTECEIRFIALGRGETSLFVPLPKQGFEVIMRTSGKSVRLVINQ